MSLQELLEARRDTRHFSGEPVPDEVLERALRAAHTAPSVGLTDATRYYVIRSEELRCAVKELFLEYNQKASAQIEDEEQKKRYASLKLEAITDAPLGLVVAYDRSVLNTFTIGTVASNETIKFSAVCAVQNMWLSLTEQGYSMGWVSILNYYRFKKLLNLPDEMEALGYFCVGRPATDYGGQPMLQQLAWKTKSAAPVTTFLEQASPLRENSLLVGPNSQSPQADTLLNELNAVIDGKTKPKGALGMLETIARQIGLVFQTTAPVLKAPHILVFAADHGIAQHGVSAYPQEVSRQMVENFVAGGAAINVFCRQNGIALEVVDAGLNYDFPPDYPIVHRKIAPGTRSFMDGPAMSGDELRLCLEKGAEILSAVHERGCNTVGFGEMGIGNTSSAALLMSLLAGIPLNECIGRGTGLNNEQLRRKQCLLEKALSNFKGPYVPEAIMAHFGGFEILQITGGILEATNRNMLVLVDGFIATVAFLCAMQFNPAVKKNAVFCHESGERGHRRLLDFLEARALLNLEMRLGEGSGCAVAYPVVRSAVAFLNEMATFDSASVSNEG